MSIMSIGINPNYSNYNGICQTNRSNTANETNAAAQVPQTLDEFKREIYNTIDKMNVHPSQSKTQISINISDKAFEKMMSDPEYKNLMLKTIQRDLNGVYPSAAAPSYSVIRIGDDCEYKADAMGSAYGGYFSKFQSTSFLEKNTKRATSDYDDFNRRKNQSNINYQDVVARNLAEKRLRDKLILDKEYEKKIFTKKLEQKEHQKKPLETDA